MSYGGWHTPESRAKWAAEVKSPRQSRAFTKEELARMFRAREAEVADGEIAKRFGISQKKLVELIGKRVSRE